MKTYLLVDLYYFILSINSFRRGRGGKGEQQFPGKHRLPGGNLSERKLNRENRMLKKRR